MERARVGRSLLRGTLTGLLGLLVAAVAPLATGPLRSFDWILFTAAAAGFVAAVAVAAVRERRALHDHGPAVVEGARIEHLLAIVLWSVAFFVLVHARLAGVPGEFVGLTTRIDAFYFTVSTLATVGFGDVHAVGQAARLVVTIQIVFNVVVLALALQILVAAVRRRTGERPLDRDGSGSPG